MKRMGYSLVVLLFCSHALAQNSITVKQMVYSLFVPYTQLDLSTATRDEINKNIKRFSYSVKYDKFSIEKLHLENANLKVKVYYNGYPKGVFTIATDEQKTFLYQNLEDRKAIIFELVSFDGQDSNGIHCVGSSQLGLPELKISCKQ